MKVRRVLECSECQGAGVIVRRGSGRFLVDARLCECIVLELGSLRVQLERLNELERRMRGWSRGLPPRSEPPEMSYVVLSTRRDGFRVIMAGDRMEALHPNGRRQPIPWSAATGAADLDEAERCVDAQFPVAS